MFRRVKSIDDQVPVGIVWRNDGDNIERWIAEQRANRLVDRDIRKIDFRLSAPGEASACDCRKFERGGRAYPRGVSPPEVEGLSITDYAAS